jgi:hypothetical protein
LPWGKREKVEIIVLSYTVRISEKAVSMEAEIVVLLMEGVAVAPAIFDFIIETSIELSSRVEEQEEVPSAERKVCLIISYKVIH